MQNVMENWNAQIMEQNGFLPCDKHPYGSLGRCYRLSSSLGEGLYWVYGEKDLFDIKIHDFYYHKDTLIHCDVTGYLCLFHYSSISGEQLTPYRRINAGCIQSIAGGKEPYKMLVHKNIPVRSIGIGIAPAYYEQHLKEIYPEEYQNPYDAFAKLNQESAFPDLVQLLKQIEIAATYLNNHYAGNVCLEQLAQFSCMSISKFKVLFKRVYGCSITSYIQQLRLSHAECLLAESDLTIGQIATSVGYSTSSRLATLLRQSTGLTPAQYRKMARRK